MKVGAHNSNYVVWATAELDCLADNIRVAAEPALPQAVAQDNNEVFAVNLFFGGEHPAEQRLALHDFEEAIAYLNRGNSFSFALARHNGVPTRVGGDVFKNGILAPVVS